MPEPTLPCDGGCACGSVRYRLLEDPLELHICHCSDCQRVSGSAFVMSMLIHRRSLELLRGEPKRSSFETTQGIRRCDQHCTACGCRLWSEPQGFPELLVLRPGTLDDKSWLQPIAHIWTSSAQPWVPIPGEVLRYAGEPDHLEMIRAWKQRGARES